MAEIIQADMRQVGVDVALVGEEESNLCPPARWSLRHDFQPYLGRTYDPHAFMSSMRVPSHADFQAQRELADKPIIDKRNRRGAENHR